MSAPAIARARRAFAERFGHAPQGVAFAPGRVNLIGDHVDYNDGLVLPMPIQQGTAVAWGAAAGAEAKIVAADMQAEDSFNPAAIAKPSQPDWRSYCRGMFAFAGDYGSTPAPLNMVISGDVPRGSGLSSSASLCVAMGRAIAASSGASPSATNLAKTAQQAEHEYAGLACGIMDQMAVAAGENGKALLLDCRTLEHRNIAVPTDWAVLIVPSGVTRKLVDGAYNLRRAQCDSALAKIGAKSWREVTPRDLDAAELTGDERKRARHVVTEISRVEQAVAAMDAGDVTKFGELINDSHTSLRDDFETSHPQVDELVAHLQAELGRDGGARITGAGFGGAVVVVARAAALPRARQLLSSLGHSPDAAIQVLPALD